MNQPPSDVMPLPQVMALVQCMLATARADGMHPKEETLICRFYEEQRQAGMLPFKQVLAATSAAPLTTLAGDSEFATQLLLMCWMTAYADGHLSDGERQLVLGFAQALGVSPALSDELLQQVKDSLIASLAHLPDAESVAALVKTL